MWPSLTCVCHKDDNGSSILRSEGSGSVLVVWGVVIIIPSSLCLAMPDATLMKYCAGREAHAQACGEMENKT